MFGKKRIQELEYKLSEANDQIDKVSKEAKDLERQLGAAVSKSSNLEESLSEAETKAKDLEENLFEAKSKASDLEVLLADEKNMNADLEGKISAADNKIYDLEQALSAEKAKSGDLERVFADAQSKIAELEAVLSDMNEKNAEMSEKNAEMCEKNAELERELAESEMTELKQKEKDLIIEYEGLKDLYSRKVKEFDDALEERERAFAREDALKRRNLEEELEENRQDSQRYVGNTVKNFSESFSFYLNQIKQLMNALGDVAVQTGKNLFTDNIAESNLKGLIGQQMADKLQSENGDLMDDEDGRILFGNYKSLDPEEEKAESGSEPALEE